MGAEKDTFSSGGLSYVHDLPAQEGNVGLTLSASGLKTVETEQWGATASAYVTLSNGPAGKTEVDSLGRPRFTDSGTSVYAGVETEAMTKSARGANVETDRLTAAAVRLGMAVDLTPDTYGTVEVSHKLTADPTYGDGITPQGRDTLALNLTTEVGKNATLSVGYHDSLPDENTSQTRDRRIGIKWQMDF